MKNKNLLTLLDNPHHNFLKNANRVEYDNYIHTNISDPKLSYWTRLDLLLCSTKIETDKKTYPFKTILPIGDYPIMYVLENYEKELNINKKVVLEKLLNYMLIK